MKGCRHESPAAALRRDLVWAAVIACLAPVPMSWSSLYFAGLAGAGMALLTPDLWSPWPSYPAVYFFVAHGGIVIAAAMLVFGRICPIGAWRCGGLSCS